MPQVQMTYMETHAAATNGMIANSLTTKVESLEFKGSNNAKFGRAVFQGTGANDCIAAGTGGDEIDSANTFRGLLVQDKTLRPSQDDEFVAGDIASVAYEGDIWVEVESAVNFNDDVTFNATTGQLSTEAVDTNTVGSKQFKIEGARWMTTQATADKLAMVRLTGVVPSK